MPPRESTSDSPACGRRHYRFRKLFITSLANLRSPVSPASSCFLVWCVEEAAGRAASVMCNINGEDSRT
ncbi:unnamed protein product [Danaus chrysippus]|uniref:(African queen) hypothetical protein n=1 Tax=Danaus chrysippus TaxID=151541 RepID=A0A8J2VRL5_9NEOP|nr:unnamed protein product [Danaus chrysippus]